jgi:3-oxoacyl-[acyl-carrier protein] reductase
MSDRSVALVTGASRGIGRAIALRLADMGFAVAVNYNSNQSAAAAVLEEIMAAGGHGRVIQGDVGSPAGRARLVDELRDWSGRCDMLVNNAGIAPRERRDVLETEEESYEQVMAVNLKGPYFLTQAIARWMIEQQREFPARKYRICNIGSLSAYASSTNRGEYCLSKAGVGMMTKLFGDRLAEYGITVCEIRPGIIRTDMTSAATEKYDRLIADGLTPIRRWGRPEDVAEAVAAVAEGRLDFSVAQVLDIDGGFHLRRL